MPSQLTFPALSKAPNSSMEFCCSCFRVQMHQPLVHDSLCPFIYHQGTEASLLELRRFMTLGSGLGFPYSPNTTGWPPLVFQGLAPMDQLSKSRTKNNLQARYPNPPNAIGCPPLVFKGFKIQIPINFTMRPSHVQGKQPHLQKASFLKI